MSKNRKRPTELEFPKTVEFKLQVYNEQGGRCALSDRQINLSEPGSYQLHHVLTPLHEGVRDLLTDAFVKSLDNCVILLTDPREGEIAEEEGVRGNPHLDAHEGDFKKGIPMGPEMFKRHTDPLKQQAWVQRHDAFVDNFIFPDQAARELAMRETKAREQAMPLNGAVNGSVQESKTNRPGGDWFARETETNAKLREGANVSNIRVTDVTIASYTLPAYRTYEPNVNGVTYYQNLSCGNFPADIVAERRAVLDGGSPPPNPTSPASTTSSPFSSFTSSVTHDSSVGKAAIKNYGVLPGCVV